MRDNGKTPVNSLCRGRIIPMENAHCIVDSSAASYGVKGAINSAQPRPCQYYPAIPSGNDPFRAFVRSKGARLGNKLRPLLEKMFLIDDKVYFLSRTSTGRHGRLTPPRDIHSGLFKI